MPIVLIRIRSTADIDGDTVFRRRVVGTALELEYARVRGRCWSVVGLQNIDAISCVEGVVFVTAVIGVPKCICRLLSHDTVTTIAQKSDAKYR